LEEAYFTVAYGPIYDDRGDIGGVFVSAVEMTARKLVERRLRTPQQLADCAAKSRSVAAAAREVVEVLAGRRLGRVITARTSRWKANVRSVLKTYVHNGYTSGTQGSAMTEVALGEFGVQAQLAGEHHRLVDQERHLDPGLAHHSVDGVLGVGGVGEQGDLIQALEAGGWARWG
jgi:hypothetical protein